MLDIGLEDQIDDYISKNQIDILALSIGVIQLVFLLILTFLKVLN